MKLRRINLPIFRFSNADPLSSNTTWAVILTFITVMPLASQTRDTQSYSSRYGYTLEVPVGLAPLDCQNGSLVDFYPSGWGLDCDELRQPGQISVWGPFSSTDQFPNRGKMSEAAIFAPFNATVSETVVHGDQELVFYWVDIENRYFEVSIDVSDPEAMIALVSLRFGE